MDHLEFFLNVYRDRLQTIPSIYYIWKRSQKYVEDKDEERIKECENLIFILHNSIVSPYVRLGDNVKFAYGGIGTVVHKDAIINNGVSIGQGVTIGGSPGKYGIDKNGNKYFVPHIEENVYIAAGCRIFGGINLGKFSVIGANSVLSTDAEQFAIYVGSPAKKIKEIRKDNCLMYRSFFHHTKNLSKEEYIKIFPDNNQRFD